ncbi:MAG: hypothetical protein ACR2KB_12520 [Chitinophagaceae bacterium]
MKLILLSAFMSLLVTTVKSQIITRYITPDSLPVIIPGYLEVNNINKKNYCLYSTKTPYSPSTG